MSGEPEPWVIEALEAEERTLAEIARLYGAGMNESQISRVLRLAPGYVADVLRFSRRGP